MGGDPRLAHGDTPWLKNCNEWTESLQRGEGESGEGGVLLDTPCTELVSYIRAKFS